MAFTRRQRPPFLADKGYQGTGIGVHTPIKDSNPGMDNRAYDALLSGMRAIGERANALLVQHWAALRRVTLSPSRIGDIFAAAFVLPTLKHGAGKKTPAVR